MTSLQNTIKIGTACFMLAMLSACNGGGGGDDKSQSSAADNSAASIDLRPISNAGADQVVTENQLVTLKAEGSYDPEGKPLLYQWRQISGPATTLSSETDDSPSFIAPSGSNTLTFQLVTDDGKNISIADTVTITVVVAPSPAPNNPSSGAVGNTGGDGNNDSDNNNDTPTQNTGNSDNSDNSDNSGNANDNTDSTNPVDDGTSSTDTPENSDGSNNVDDSNSTDSSDNTHTDTNQNETPTVNTSPTANAGLDKTIEGFSLLVLDGSLSSDPENDPLSYSWQQTAGTPVTLNNSAIVSPNFDTPNINDTLSFSLTVSDGEFTSTADSVTITLLQVNTPPNANAGPDKIAQGFNQVSLQGSLSSDPEGDTLSYQWQQTAGPTVTLTNPQIANPSFEAPNINASLSFSLVVNDGELSSNTDTVNVTIQAINTAPIADAGLSQMVQGLNEVNLNGTLSLDAENDALTYTWEQVSGTMVTLNNADTALASFTAPNIDDTLVFSLSVNDGELNSPPDTVSVSIEKINSIPVAHAGVDRFVGSLSIVALNGTLSNDADNDPLNYSWSQLSGPSVTLSDMTAAKPIFEANTDGELIFSLIVSDGQNNSEADTVKVTVGPIPATNIKVNGTGITWGANYPTGNNDGCIGEAIAQQDCSLGREVTHNDNSDGRVGFNFTKFDSNGVDVGNNASEWQCVQDSVTGLMWEVKSGGNDIIGDEGINDADDRYSWYNSDPASNGGGVGFINSEAEICADYDADKPDTHCNTQAFVARMNKNAWCGFADWRLPNRKELLSIVDYGNTRPMIDSDYFPAVGQYVWTSTPLALGSNSAWGVNFDYGNSFSIDKRNPRQVRLVRGGYE